MNEALARLHEPRRSRRDRSGQVPPGGASPMTSCLRANWRWRWCGRRIRKADDGRPLVGDGRYEALIRAALPYSLTESQEASRLSEIKGDLALPERMLRLLAGRRRLRKDRRGAAGDGARGGGRRAGGAHGADRNPGAPAPGDHRTACGERAGLRAVDPDRAGEGHASGQRTLDDIAVRARSTSCSARTLCSRKALHLPRSGARHRRRAAPLRCAPAPGDVCKGRHGRHAGDDRDAHPANAGADRVRRHGRVAPDRKNRPAAGRSRRRRLPLERLGGSRGAPEQGGRRGPEGLLDLPARRGIRGGEADVGGRALHCAPAGLRRQDRSDPRPDERPRQGRGDARLQGRRNAPAGGHDGDRGRVSTSRTPRSS
jgi:hypothetical protein